MPSRVMQAKLQALTRRCAELKRQEGQLLHAREMLVYRQTLLDSLCGCFVVSQLNQAAQLSDDEVASSQSGLEVLVQLETSLLHELGGPVVQQVQTLPAPDLGISTVASRTDPLAYYKQIAALPLRPEATTMTAAELAGLLRDTVLQASVQLHLAQSGAKALRGPSVERIAQLWTTHCHTLYSLLLSGRPEVVEEINMYNLSTLQADSEAGQRQAASIAGIPAALELTQQQIMEIAAGAELFKGLLQRIMQELQQLQLKVSSQSTCSGSHASSGSLASLPRGQDDLETQQRDTQRLQVLLRKEYAIRAAVVAWLVGCMSWEQITLAAIMCWPYSLRLSQLVMVVADSAQELQGLKGLPP